VRAVPRLCELYPGICLTAEEEEWKNLSQGIRNTSVRVENLSQGRNLRESSFTGARHCFFPWARTIQSVYITSTNERHSEIVSLQFVVRRPGPALEYARGWTAPSWIRDSSVCSCCHTKRAVGTDSKVTSNNDPQWRGPIFRGFTDAFFANFKLNWFLCKFIASRIYCCKDNQIAGTKYGQKLISIIFHCITRNLGRKMFFEQRACFFS